MAKRLAESIFKRSDPIPLRPTTSRLVGQLPLGTVTPHTLFAAIMLYIVVAIVFDLIVLRRFHPGDWWGAGTVALPQLLTGPIGFRLLVVAFARSAA